MMCDARYQQPKNTAIKCVKLVTIQVLYLRVDIYGLLAQKCWSARKIGLRDRVSPTIGNVFRTRPTGSSEKRFQLWSRLDP